jgi:hypothetical protein
VIKVESGAMRLQRRQIYPHDRAMIFARTALGTLPGVPVLTLPERSARGTFAPLARRLSVGPCLPCHKVRRR